MITDNKDQTCKTST